MIAETGITDFARATGPTCGHCGKPTDSYGFAYVPPHGPCIVACSIPCRNAIKYREELRDERA